MTGLLRHWTRRVTGPAGRRLCLVIVLTAAWAGWAAMPSEPRVRWTLPASWLSPCALTPDGGTLVVPATGKLKSFEDEVARQGRGSLAQLWDPVTGRQRLSVQSDNPDMSLLEIAPNGSWLLTGDLQRLYVLDGFTGTPRATFVTHRWKYAVAPDSRTLAVVDENRRLVLWDAATGRTAVGFQFQRGADFSLVFSRDSRSLAAFDGPDPVELLGPHPDGSGHHWPEPRTDGRSFVRVWDMATGRERAALAVPTCGPEPLLALSHDGRRLALYDVPLPQRPAVLQVWDVGTPNATTVAALPDGPGSFPHRASSQIEPIEFSPDGRLLVLRPQGHKGLMWDIAQTPRRLDDLLAQDRTPTSYGEGACSTPPASPFPYFSPDGRWLLVPGREPGLLSLRPAAAVNRCRILRLCAPEDDAQPVFSPDGRTLAVTTPGNSWIEGRLKPWLNQLLGCRFVPRHQLVVQLFDTATGTERAVWTVSGYRYGGLLGFGPDGRSVWTAVDATAPNAADGLRAIGLWDEGSGRTPAWLLAATAIGLLLAVADSVAHAATASGYNRGMSRLQRLTGPVGRRVLLALALAAAWLACLNLPPRPLREWTTASQEPGGWLLTPDHTRLACVTRQVIVRRGPHSFSSETKFGPVRLWDLATGRELFTAVPTSQ